MIKSEYLNSMYGIFLDKNVLTTKELLSIGFTNRDLTRLKEKGILSSSERGFYEINDSSVYLSYLKNLVADGKYDNVSNIINNNIDILDFSENDLLELFDISISVHNYDFASAKSTSFVSMFYDGLRSRIAVCDFFEVADFIDREVTKLVSENLFSDL